MNMSRGLWNLAGKVLKGTIEKNFEYSFEDFGIDAIEGPVFIVTNHVCAWDPVLIGFAVKERQLAFVASEHTLRMPKYGKLMGKYLDVIPHRKAGGGTSSVRECLQRIKKGESIFIASEGEQTWDGRTKPVVNSTGKLIKKSGTTLVTMRIDGGYLAKPRWAENVRRGKVYVHHVNIYTPEELASMSPEEVNDAINRDIYFDIWEWQREAELNGGMHKYISSKGGLAEGLERMMYICPSCKKVDTLKSRGDEIGCDCGFKMRFTETGFLELASVEAVSESASVAEPLGATATFETVAEWSDWQDDLLGEMIEKGGDGSSAELFSDAGFMLCEIANDHTERKVADGKLSLVWGSGEDALYIDIAGTRFALSEISAMAMILANRIVFSANKMYYEIRPHDLDGRLNLRKYLVAWQKSRGASENTEE